MFSATPVPFRSGPNYCKIWSLRRASRAVAQYFPDNRWLCTKARSCTKASAGCTKAQFCSESLREQFSLHGEKSKRILAGMALLRQLVQYFIAVCGSWVSIMSGIGGLILCILLIFWGDEWAFLKDNKTTFVWLAVICLFVTSFVVWYKNRPDLLIEQRDVFLDAGGDRDEAMNATPRYVTIRLYMVSTSNLPVAIKSYELTVEAFGRKVSGQIIPTHMVTLYTERQTDLNKNKNTLMQQGLPVEGWVRFYLSDILNLKGQPFVLTITDTFNISRNIKGRIPLDCSDEIRKYIPPEAFRC